MPVPPGPSLLWGGRTRGGTSSGPPLASHPTSCPDQTEGGGSSDCFKQECKGESSRWVSSAFSLLSSEDV